MKTHENAEIGEMIQEILLNGFQVEVFQRWEGKSPPGSPPVHYVSIQSNDLRETPERNSRLLKSDNLIEALEKAVNVTRYIIGKPSLQKEIANMIAAEEEHAKELIQCGPDAHCACGSRKPLIVERKVTLEFHWDGKDHDQTNETLRVFTGYEGEVYADAIPGEIGRCPDCGKWYRLTA